MTVYTPIIYNRALETGATMWRLELNNWGNVGTGADANSETYVVGTIGSSQAVMIGPDSTVDMTVVGYTDPGVFGITSFAPAPSSGLTQSQVTVGVTRPGVIMPGPLVVTVWTPEKYGDEYMRDGNPTPQAFGGAEQLFESPRLQLLVYLNQPTVTPWPKRNDMYRNAATIAEADVGTETLIGIWPVMGRGCKSLYFRATGDLVATMRVGGITSFNAGANPAIEDTVNTSTVNINAGTGVTASVTTGRPMHYIAAYYTRASGTGSIHTALIAQDC